MRNFKFVFCLWSFGLLFSGPGEAELSKEEKKELINQSARSFPEGQVFYRWQTDTQTKRLLEAGEMTEELYREFMDTKVMQNSLRERPISKLKDLAGMGPGMYLAEDIHSSHQTGQTIVRVRLDPHFKYIDKRDLKVRKELKRKGLSWEDVLSLAGPRIAFKFNSTFNHRRQWLVIRGREGVRFEPFSFQDVALEELEAAYRRAENAPEGVDEKFKEAIKEEFAERAGRDVTVTDSFLMKTLDAKTADSILNRHKKSADNIQTATEGVNLLKYLGGKFSSTQREKILSQTTALANTVDEKIYLFNQAEDYLSQSAKVKLLQETIPHIKTADRLVKLLPERRRSLLTPDMRRALGAKIRELTVESHPVGRSLYTMSYWVKGFSDRDRQKILDQTVFHIEGAFEGAEFLKRFEKQLSFENRKKIMEKILGSIDGFTTGRKLLVVPYMPRDPEAAIGHIFSLEETKSIARKSVSHYETMDEAVKFFKENHSWHVDLFPEAAEEIINTLLSHVKNSEDGIQFPRLLGNHWYFGGFLPEHRRLILNKILSHIKTAEEGLKLIHSLEFFHTEDYIGQSGGGFLKDTELIISRILMSVETAEEGAEFLNRLEIIFRLSPELLFHFRESVVNHILSLIQTAEEGARTLDRWRGAFHPVEKQAIKKRIFSRIDTADIGIHLLRRDSFNRLTFSESDRELIVDKMLPHIPSAEEGAKLLRFNKGVFFESEKYRIAKEKAETGKESALFRELLSAESYKELKKVKRRENIREKMKCIKNFGRSLLFRGPKQPL